MIFIDKRPNRVFRKENTHNVNHDTLTWTMYITDITFMRSRQVSTIECIE